MRVLMGPQNDEIHTPLARVVDNTFTSVAKFHEVLRPAKFSGFFGNKLVQRAKQLLFSLCHVISCRRLCRGDVQYVNITSEGVSQRKSIGRGMSGCR